MIEIIIGIILIIAVIIIAIKALIVIYQEFGIIALILSISLIFAAATLGAITALKGFCVIPSLAIY